MQLNLGDDLAGVKAKTLVAIDSQAEASRLRYVTPGAGQAMEYTATEAEARRWAVGESFTLYPFLAAEADAVEAATGTRPSEAVVVADVIAQADAWVTIGSTIKRIRREAKMAVEAATTVAQVRAIQAALLWP